ncbi:MAG: prepilin-type N-terminal cleavage/methylation domain-containing protein [Polyangiaceae bacterium]|nr:prepilin-type N-terminal cleavage/methylation domain-containing protein [Polyangiaceae bacterium]
MSASGSQWKRRAPSQAFTLLEVMVAVAILGLALTVILSAQGGLAASNKSAQNMGLASNYGRCKMSEVEEKLLRNGYPDIDQNDTDTPCCDDSDNGGFTCDVRIEKVELPNPNTTAGDAGLDLQSALGAPPVGSAGAAGPGAVPPLASLDLDAGLQGVGAQVAGQMGPAGAQGMLTTVLGLVYPSLKPVLEASIRRVSITVKWKEGPNARELPIVQFVTSPQKAGFLAGFDGGTPPATGTATPATTAATPGTK